MTLKTRQRKQKIQLESVNQSTNYDQCNSCRRMNSSNHQIKTADWSIRTGQRAHFQRDTYKVHGGAFQPAAHPGWVELVLAPRYWKRCHGGGVQKQKLDKKHYQEHSTSERYKNGQDDKTEGAASAADVFPHLRQEQFLWQRFLHIPVLLLYSGWRFITAQQFGWWMTGGEGKLRIKGKRWRSSRTSPASPGTCPGQQLQLLLWRKSQLSLASSDLPPPHSFSACGLYPETFFELSLLFLCLSYSWSELETIRYLSRRNKELMSLLPRSPTGLQRLHPTKWRVDQAAGGKYGSSPSFKISPPPR